MGVVAGWGNSRPPPPTPPPPPPPPPPPTSLGWVEGGEIRAALDTEPGADRRQRCTALGAKAHDEL
jgi:hypothetical protein